MCCCVWDVLLRRGRFSFLRIELLCGDGSSFDIKAGNKQPLIKLFKYIKESSVFSFSDWRQF
jgi:hypothetical protein